MRQEYSAQQTFSKSQKLFFSTLLIISAVLLYQWPWETIFISTLLLTVLYLGAGLVRIAILSEYESSNLAFRPITDHQPNGTYSVLVAIYNEANQVRDLVAALSKLKWSRGKIHIQIICEEEDLPTIKAVRQCALPDHIHLVICPKGTPQTKPRALNYALETVNSDYLVIYDAEDRPHPDQLLEAHQKFLRSDENLACLQAPLVVDNFKGTFFSEMFAIEYSTLFYGINPAIALWQSPMPLGGTSNHFNGIR